MKFAKYKTASIKVAIFCGGRGSATIVREFLRRSSVQLTLLINAYDDGLSTGSLRNFIPGMLGPSDFRKNFSYVLDLYSGGQYALRDLLEYRLPLDFGLSEKTKLKEFVRSGATIGLPENLVDHIARLDRHTKKHVRHLVGIFLKYAEGSEVPFDFRDCSVGNLMFAGAYLQCGQNFNTAAATMSHFVNSQAVVVNVSGGENRILAGLKADGQLLLREAEIVGMQSNVPILDTFFLSEPIKPEAWAALGNRTVDEKMAWLKEREAKTELSAQAREALGEADIIVYGPGTQHSSLLPSYRMARDALRAAPAPVKLFVVNLASDNDIQGLYANDLVDLALMYVGDPENRDQVITHLLLNENGGVADAIQFEPGKVSPDSRYQGARVIRGSFSTGDPGRVHNGYNVAREIIRIWEHGGDPYRKPTLEVFADLHKRSLAVAALIDEFLEIDWLDHFEQVCLRVQNTPVGRAALPRNIQIERVNWEGPFPEVREVLDWWEHRKSDYLVTITGDGEYRLRDVQAAASVLKNSTFGAVYGSRTQSRRQFSSSLRAAYGERRVLRAMSFLGAFLFSILFALRFGIVFSDPMTGFRIYRRRYMERTNQLLNLDRLTPTSITKNLVRSKVEIAELPVHYRTFVGFTEPWWRLRRGIRNLYSLLR